MALDNDGKQASLNSPAPFFEGPLKRRVLMELPAWGILQSNVTKDDDDPSPALEVILGPPNTRAGLWERIRQQRLNGRKFRLFTDGASYDSHMAERDEALLTESVADLRKTRRITRKHP